MGNKQYPNHTLRRETGIGPAINTIETQSNFSLVTRIGVAQDTDNSAISDVFKSVCGCLSKAGFLAPSRLMEFSQGAPQTGIYLFPNCKDQGELESLCLEVIADKPEFACVENFIKCVNSHIQPENINKTKFYTWLSCQNLSQPLLGKAINENSFNVNHPALHKLKQFIIDLNAD